jgi:hypothetical protein
MKPDDSSPTLGEPRKARAGARGRPRLGAEAGAVLLEVVLALALFVAAATVLTGGVNASVQAVDKLRLENHAMDLAITLVSEMQMHARPVEAVAERAFEAPFEDWNYTVELHAIDSDVLVESLNTAEVVVRHTREGVVVRLYQVVRMGDALSEEEREALGAEEVAGDAAPMGLEAP